MLIIYLLLIVAHCELLLALCSLKTINDHFDRDVDLVFVKHGSERDYFIYNNPQELAITEKGLIKIFCTGGFSEYYFEDHGPIIKFANGNYLQLDCHEGFLYHETITIPKVHKHLPYNILCRKSETFFSKTIDFQCEHDALVYGLYIGDSPIIFATLCYNFINQNLTRITYPVIGHYSNEEKLSEYVRFKNIHFNKNGATFALSELKNKDVAILRNTSSIPEYKELLNNIKFIFEDLSLFQNHAGLLRNLTGDPTAITGIPWWENLLNGNWKIYQQLLKKRTAESSFVITAGKSHYVTYPKNCDCDDIEYKMTVEISGKEKIVPFYIWNFIQSTDVAENFVIIGVNSPFVDDCKRVAVCDDICESIAWLDQLEITRMNSNFGCVFCCKPQQVVLDGFVSNHNNVNVL